MKFYTNIDLKGNEIQNASVEKLSVAPENPTLGQTYYNTTDNLYYIYTNHGWETLAYASTNITTEEKERFETAFEHTQDLSNPHGTTKIHIGLPAVDNIKQAPYTHIGKGGGEHATATPAANGFMSSSDKGKLNGIEINAQRNVNADWNATSGNAQILNKPIIPTKTSELINDSGFETPLGAQDKANQAEQNANYYTDTQLLNYDTTAQVENKIINSEIATKNYSDGQDLTTLGLANDYTDEEIAKINQMQIHGNSYHTEDYLVAADVMTKSDVGHTHDSLYEPKNENIQTHINQTDNPHQVSKSQIGLGNVENKSALDIINEITSTNILNALGFTPENSANKGLANGYAELDSTGKIPLSKLPDTSKQQTYVVLNSAARPTENLIIGDRCYETSTGDAYIWDGNSWLILTQADWENVNLEWANLNGKPISEVSAIDSAVQSQHTHTNKTVLDNINTEKVTNWESAFNHSEIIGANPHGTTKDQIGLGNLDNIKQTPYTHIGTGGTEHALASATTHGFMSSSDKAKLNGIQSGAEVNVNADWNASSGDAQILNKPAILDPSHASLVASPTTLGHIKIGNNLTIDLDGKLHAEAGGGSADIVSYNNSISLLLAENVQDAIDEVVASLGDIDLSADNITESATRVWVSPTEKTTWNSKAASDHTHADLHNHINKAILDNLSEDGDDLLYKGSSIGGSTYSITGETFISTINQTVFTLTNGEYTPGANRAQLYVWGVQQPKTSFIETNSTTITLHQALPAGTEVYIEWVEVANIEAMYLGHAATHASGGADAITPQSIGAEPSFTKNTGFNKTFGTGFDNVARGNHTHTLAALGAEPSFIKNTAFNKNFGTTAGTVCQGNDSRLSDARTPLTHTHTKSQITDFAHTHSEYVPIADKVKIHTSTSAPTSGDGANGDFWFVYE